MKEKGIQVNSGRRSELIYNLVKKEVSSKLKKKPAFFRVYFFFFFFL